MLNPPRPGSWGDSTSTPPPPSCSPFKGKSSSNTNTESFEGGNGVGCASTVKGAIAVPAGTQDTAGAVGEQVSVNPADETDVHVIVAPVAPHLTAAAISAPPMPWPVPVITPPLPLPVSNGVAESPGSTER